jgi:hypothetical protein
MLCRHHLGTKDQILIAALNRGGRHIRASAARLPGLREAVRAMQHETATASWSTCAWRRVRSPASR